MQKAVPTGSKGAETQPQASQSTSRLSQYPGHGLGHLAQLAVIANSSSQVQTQLKMAQELRSSSQVEAQRNLAADINTASPVAAQLKRLEEKPTQTKGKLDEKKPMQAKDRAINDETSVESEADVMGATAATVQAAVAQGQGAGVIQRAPRRVQSIGITHLVHEDEGSIFEGFEVESGELSPGQKLVIDDEDIIVSRRGPNQEINREQDRLGPQIHDWYHVLVVNGVDVREKQLYVRDKTFVADDSPYESGVLKDPTAAATLTKFQKAIELFRQDEEMSFADFCQMLTSAGFTGSIHAEDPENMPIVKFSQPRKNLIDQLGHVRELALKPLFGDEEAVRSGILIGALQGTGCLAAQSRDLQEKVNLVNKLLDGHVELIEDMVDHDVTEQLHTYVEKQLGKYLKAGSDKEKLEFKDFEKFITPLLEACAAYEKMLRRENTTIINRTLSQMHELVGKLITALEESPIEKLGKEIIKEYSLYRPVWTRVCPDLLTGVSLMSKTALELLDKLHEVEKQVQTANLKIPDKVLERILDHPQDYLEAVVQKLGKNLAVTITYKPRTGQGGGGIYTFTGPSGEGITKTILPQFQRQMNLSHIRIGIEGALKK